MESMYAGGPYGASRVAERVSFPGGEWPGAGAAPRPAVDEHLVEPETRAEVIQGARVHASPARSPHADRHFTIDYVLGAHLARGYVGATDLLTRWSPDDDYATDTSVRRAGIDATTGERHLEELVFEVAYQQRRRELDERARLLCERGVRRVFAVFIKEGTVEEWSPVTKRWRPFASTDVIEDRCLSQPLAVRALLDAASADESVARALVARRHPVIEDYGHARYREGASDHLLRSLRRVLSRRGLLPDARQRALMATCTDPDMLDDWLCRAATATHADQVFLGHRDDVA